MIALLLAAQLSAEVVRGMPADIVPAPPSGLVRSVPQGLPLKAVPPPYGYITPVRPGGIARAPPPKGCGAGLGRLEVSTAQPAALYRRGDRPAKGLRDWIDYPNGGLCLVEAAR